MTCPKRMENACISNEINHFAGILPCHHNESGCHKESTKRRKIFCEMKKLLKKMESLPKCDEWDTSKTLNNTKGPYKIGEYDRRGKPWDLDRVPSKELIGGVLIPTCLCSKRNGLQDDCRRTQCKGRPWCLSEPWPDCPPFTKIPKQWIDEDPLLMCPNYYKPEFSGPEDIANRRMSAEKFRVGCSNGTFSFSEIPRKSLPTELQTGGPIYALDKS